MITVVISTWDAIERPVTVTALAPFQSELTPKDDAAVNELYERAKEQERVEAVLARMTDEVLHERRARREPGAWVGDSI